MFQTMSGIGIILNPYSRSYKHNPGRMERLGFIVGDKASCHATHDILDVEALAKEFKEKQIEILGISGGDGTNHVTLTTFIKVYGDTPLPKIALLLSRQSDPFDERGLCCSSFSGRGTLFSLSDL